MAYTRAMTIGPYCDRCGPTRRDPIVPYRCGQCAAPIKAPLRYRLRRYRHEAALLWLFLGSFAVVAWLLDGI